MALFLTIQTIEGNIITPKVVGSSIQLNPLAAILALFIGGFIWGVEGLILALPLVAILRIFMIHTDRFRPFGLLMSDDLVEREQEFLTSLDQPHHRFINLFRAQPQAVVRARASVHTDLGFASGTDGTEGAEIEPRHTSSTGAHRADDRRAQDVDLELEVEQEETDQMTV